MIIYLYGPDSYRRQEKVRWYVEQFKEKHSGLSIERFALSAEALAKAELEKLKDFASAQSLFDKTKLGIICNVSVTDSKEIVPILKSVMDDKTITLIISEDKKLPKDFDFLSKAFKVREFEKPTEAELKTFIKKEAEKRKLKLSFVEINSLIGLNNSDIWGIVNDLDKLELGGSLDEHIPAQNFWSLINKAKNGDIAALTWLLENEEPAKIFNMMASMAPADAKALARLADLDVAIKRGKLDYEEALLDLVTSKQ